MLEKKTIGFIGAGNMAETLFTGLIGKKLATPDQILCADVRHDHLATLAQRHRIRVASDNREVVQNADIIVNAVKPQTVAHVLGEIAEEIDGTQLLISIAAGVPLSAMEAALPSNARLVRAMPNVCVSVGEGATAIAPGNRATPEDLDLAQFIFRAVGRCIVLANDALLDAVTGLSGSGPAYVFMFIDALADGGVKAGLARQDAVALAAQTVLGAARMLIETGNHPGVLKDMVTSPGGTTIAGLHALEEGRLRAVTINAVEAATARSKALGALMADAFQEKP